MPIVLNPSGGNAVDLVTSTQAQNALVDVSLDLTVLATIITAASRAVIRYCGDRYFIRQTFVEEYAPSIEGLVMLRQSPVNRVIKVEGTRDTALVISFSQTQGQSAWVGFSTTGSYAAGTLIYTGLILSSVTNGVETDTTLLFTTYPTIGQLATQIGSIAGWTAATGSVDAEWASTALITADVAQGAMSMDGCELEIYSEVLTGCQMDPRTGLLATGRRHVDRLGGPAWGPDWQIFEDAEMPGRGSVRVTYDAGFDTVPEDVQAATIACIKAFLQELQTDTRYDSQTAESVNSKLAELGERIIPESIQKVLSRYVLNRA